LRFLARSLYRSRQFFSSLHASTTEDERAEVNCLLGAKEADLFFAMIVRDQRHCLDVLRELEQQGQTDRDLLCAALLHDAGKGRVRIWHRVAYVVIRAVSPRLLNRLTSRKGAFGSGLASIANHAERGASLAQAAGASADVVRLIRNHEALGSPDTRQSLLRAADEKC
jgi:predicted HD phosphohydrolase